MECEHECYDNHMCDSFAHSPLFTHDAIMDLCAPVAIPPRTYDLCEYSYHELAYLHGLDKPHYPVPAIQYDAMIGRKGVEVARIRGDWNDYNQICETVYLFIH